jgi:hypothetical protein
MNTSAAIAVAGAGQLAWNPDNNTIDIGMNANTTLQVGQEELYYVKNQTGSDIADGTVVMAAGTNGAGGIILVTPAVANGSFPSKYIIGIATEVIPDGGDGFVTSFGKVRGLDTSAFSEGDILYADPAIAGGLSNTAPIAPNNIVTVAIVINKHPSVGTIFVRPTYGHTFTDSEDVLVTDILDGQVLTYSSANSRFENMTATGGTGDEANLFNTYTTLTANDYNTYTTLNGSISGIDANLFNTYYTLAANDFNTYTVLNSNLSGITANLFNTYNTLTANDFNTYTTLTANIYNTFAYLNANVGGGGGDVGNAWVNANDYNTYTTLQSEYRANDYATYTTLQGEFAANDFNTYNTLTANTYNTYTALTSSTASVDANLFNTYNTLTANDYNTYTTLTANIYNTFAYLNANVGGGGGGDVANAWVNANDWATLQSAYANDYTLFTSIKSFNIISVAGQANVAAGDFGSTLRLIAGANVTIATNASANSITISSTASGGGGGGTEDEFARTVAFLGL